MLRFLGFMTGSALTAALALAIVDPVTLESLRRSAATLFLGVDPAASAATEMAQSAPDDAAERPAAGSTGSLGVARSRLLAALTETSSVAGPAVAAPPAMPHDADPEATGSVAAASQAMSDVGRSGDDRSGPVGSTAERAPPVTRGAPPPVPGPADAANRIVTDGMSQAAGPFADAPSSPADVASAGAPPGESALSEEGSIASGDVESRDPASAEIDAGRGPAAALEAVPSDAGTLAATAGDADIIAGAPAQPATDDGPQTPTAGPPAFAEAPRSNSAGASLVDVSGADLGTLPPPSGAGASGGWHAFWTPFRSEASASGFARHLERATGEPYRVVRTGPGAYRVAFWHENDDARSRRLLAIEQASGLSLRGGTL